MATPVDINTVPEPTTRQIVSNNLLIEPLGGPQTLDHYLDFFPDELYDKGPYSRLVYLLYTLLGPAGVGSSRKQYLQFRLLFENSGLSLYALDQFFGDPLRFGRLTDEVFDTNTVGLFPSSLEDIVKAYNASYFSRITQFLNGARLGSSPAGMQMIAEAGLGHEAEVIENYRYLYSIHSDVPQQMPYLGKTDSTEEMVVLPRRTLSQSESQIVFITGSPSGGSFQLKYQGLLSPGINWNASALEVQGALEAVPGLGPGQIFVSGGPGPENPWIVRFTGQLANTNVPQMGSVNFLLGGLDPQISIVTGTAGIDSVDEIVNITPSASRSMRDALDRIKPMTTLPTLHPANGTLSEQVWRSVLSSSSYIDVIRYVTGLRGVVWPPLSDVHWIEGGVEHEARKVADTLHYHYESFHHPAAIYAYGDDALADPNYTNDISTTLNYKSQHIGQFTPPQTELFPDLSRVQDPDLVLSADQANPSPFEQIKYTDTLDTERGQRRIVNDFYSVDYSNYVPTPQNEPHIFWSSTERTQGSEYLEIDFGLVQAVNLVTFEILAKPIDITIEYDLLDQTPRRNFIPVTPEQSFPFTSAIFFSPDTGPWDALEFHVVNGLNQIIYTRYIRIQFQRRTSTTEPFLYDNNRRIQAPWSIEIRNLRIGRAAAES